MPTRLTADVRWLDLRGVNAYLLAEEGDVTLIDVGAPWTRRGLRDGLSAAGYGPRDVDRIALTHFDVDHVGGFGGLPFDAPVYAGDPDAAVLRGERVPAWTNRKTAFQRASATLLGGTALPVETVSEGGTVGPLTVQETPGHTPGHLAFVDEGRSVAFVGDLVRESDGRLEPSPWALSYDTDAVKVSIRQLAELDLDIEILAMGHGTPFVEGGAERLADLAARL